MRACILFSKEKLIRKSSAQRNWISEAAQMCSTSLSMFVTGMEPDLCKPCIKEKHPPPKEVSNPDQNRDF